MLRNLKTMGLAAIAVFILSVVTASAAMGTTTHHITVGTAPAILTGEQSQALELGVTEGEHTVGCKSGLYEAEKAETTTTEVTATPTVSECKVDNFVAATVELNHCAFRSNGVTDANGHAGISIECAKKEGTEEYTEVTITYSVFGSSCVIHLPPQQTQGGVHYSQSGNNVSVDVTVSGMKYHETGSGFCPASHTGEDGTINGRLLASAFKTESCSALTGTAKTTPENFYNECEGAEQKLEVKEEVT